MDNAVSLVQAFLRLYGYFTVTEFPVVHAALGGGHECLTDLDILAFRFGESGGSCDPADHSAAGEVNTLLGVPADAPDMIIGEVKEGRAELNAAATKHEVLTAALERFGCCRHEDIGDVVRELLRHGRARTRHGHAVRLVAFGALAPGPGARRCHVVRLGDVVAHLRTYIRQHWDALQASASKDPGLGMLMTLEKADRGHAPSVHGARPPANRQTDSAQQPQEE
jgi:hypothetical protein